MKALFRVDASLQIGAGHVMRCLTLANALKAQGADCRFICRDLQGNLVGLIRERGYRVYSLPCANDQQLQRDEYDSALAHASWLGTVQEIDADQCCEIIQSLTPDWLVVDHYALDIRWERIVRKYCHKLMVIDDLADRHHDCDILIDQTLGRGPQDYTPWVPECCQLICGAKYALLRPEFAQWRQYSLKRRRSGKLEHLLVNLGGVDKNNVTTRILLALKNSPLPDTCRITVVMGLTAPWIVQVQQHATRMQWPTAVKVGVSNMAELMASSDMAIGAAGATSWERCCLGVPTIMVVLAENQKLIAGNLKAAGAALQLESCEINNQNLGNCLGTIAKNIKSMIDASANITDGFGCDFVLNEMMGINDGQ